MATKHWGRDAYCPNDGVSTYGGNQHFANLMLYHMLRVADFDRLWECDGEVGPMDGNPNHVEDGNMGLIDTSKWSDIGTPTTTKDTTTVRSGQRSLKIVTDAASEGVQSANLLSITNPTTATFNSGSYSVSTAALNGSQVGLRANMSSTDLTNCRVVSEGWANAGNNGTFLMRDPWYSSTNIAYYAKIQNPGGVAEAGWSSPPDSPTWRFERKYEIEIWAHNTSGVSWNVLVDPGDGTPVSVGSIPVNVSGWVLYHFSFYAVSTGSRYIQIVDPSGGHTIYIDGINVFRSSYEYAPMNVYGSDGILTNPDQFSTGGSYTPGARDVGMWLFVWDDSNNKNTGWYKITADLGGGVVQLDLRSGTAALTTNAAGNLRWRIVDVAAQAHNDALGNAQRGMGFGVQSPHSSGWRMFSRMMTYSGSSDTKSAITWCAPNDEADFDWSTGQFYTDGPSSQRNMEEQYVYDTFTNRHSWSGMYGSAYLDTKDWFMTDADRSFVFFAHIHAGAAQHACFIMGYTGADPDHPGIEEFVNMMHWESPSTAEIGWSSVNNFTYWGVTFDPDGIAVPCCSPVLAHGIGTDYVLGQSNAGPNPWSGKEWIHPLIIERDPTAANGCPSERDSDIGVFCCRNSLPSLATFDSNNYLKFTSLLAIEWSGEAII
jgi:hypothetical protein